jgi:hypothetical protein
MILCFVAIDGIPDRKNQCDGPDESEREQRNEEKEEHTGFCRLKIDSKRKICFVPAIRREETRVAPSILRVSFHSRVRIFPRDAHDGNSIKMTCHRWRRARRNL